MRRAGDVVLAEERRRTCRKDSSMGLRAQERWGVAKDSSLHSVYVATQPASHAQPLRSPTPPNRLTQRASDNRPKLQEGLANEAPHFKALATFMGFFYKRHSQVEVLGLLEYLIDMLRNRSSHGLHVRKDPRPATYADCLSPGRSL